MRVEAGQGGTRDGYKLEECGAGQLGWGQLRQLGQPLGHAVLQDQSQVRAGGEAVTGS